MKLHIANYFEADRRSCKAGEAIGLGNIIYLVDDGTGGRRALKVTNSDAAKLLVGNYAVAFKVSADPFQVTGSTVNADSSADLGDRIVAIASGDAIVEVHRPATFEFDPSLLHESLDPARGGTTPEVGDPLHIVDSMFCEVGTASAISSPVVARVERVFGTKVLVRLVA